MVKVFSTILLLIYILKILFFWLLKLDYNINRKTKEKFFSKPLLNKYLCGYLDIFAKFTSPTSWFQEEKLRDLILNVNI